MDGGIVPLAGPSWLQQHSESHFFLAVQDSSIGDLVSQSVINSFTDVLISASSEHRRAVVDLADN